VSLLDQRSAQSRLIKERLANERKAPSVPRRKNLALLPRRAAEQDSCPRHAAKAIHTSHHNPGKCWRRVAFHCAQAILGSPLSPVCRHHRGLCPEQAREVDGWLWLLGFLLPYFLRFVFRRNQRFEKFEELFPEAIDTLARAVPRGHAFTTALERFTAEVGRTGLPASFGQLLTKNRSSVCPSATPHQSHRAMPRST